MQCLNSTTIIGIYSGDGHCGVVASDGQATLETMVIKSNTKKVYRLYNERVLVGFAGATADCLALLDKFEGKLKKYDGQLRRSAVELTKEWRTAHLSCGYVCGKTVQPCRKPWISAGEGFAPVFAHDFSTAKCSFLPLLRSFSTGFSTDQSERSLS